MASAGDIRAGGAWLEVTAKTDKLKAALGTADKQLRDFGNKARGWSLGTAAAIGAGFFAAKAAVGGAMNALINYGDHFDKMAQRTGLGVEALGEFEHMAGLCGTSIETFEGAITKMHKGLDDAGRGTGTAKIALENLGITVADLAAKKPEDKFKTLAAAVADVDDPTQRAALAMQLFGKSGTQLLPLFNSGAAGMEQMAQSAHDLGLTMSTEDAAAAATLGDEISKLKQSFFGLIRTALTESVPSLTKFASQLTESVKKVITFVKEHKALVAGVLKSVTVFAGMTAAIIGAAKAFSMLQTAFAALSMNPVTLGIIGITAAAAGIYTMMKKVKDESYALADAKEKLSAKNRELRATNQDYFAKLEEIAAKQYKTNDEIDKAAFYANELNTAYGGLGITVDATTGKIDGLSEALKKMNEAQKAQRIADLKAEIAEQKSNADVLRDKRQEIIDRAGEFAVSDFGDSRFKGFTQEKGDEFFAREENKHFVEEGLVYKDEKSNLWKTILNGNDKEFKLVQDQIAATQEQITSRQEILTQLENGFDVEEARDEASGAAGANGASGESGAGNTAQNRIAEYNQQFDERHYTEHERKIAEINKRYDALIAERVKELVAGGMAAEEAAATVENEEAVQTARQNRDTLISEETADYERRKKEGVNAEIEKYNQTFEERNFDEHEKNLASISGEYEELVKKRKAELIKTEGLTDEQATERIQNDVTIQTARQNRDTLIEEENTRYAEEQQRIAEEQKTAAAEQQRAAEEQKRAAAALIQTPNEKRLDTLNVEESRLTGELQKALERGKNQKVVDIVDQLSGLGREREDVEKAVAVEKLVAATERFNAATTNLVNAEKTGDPEQIARARQDHADAATDLNSARNAAAGIANDLRTAAEQARQDENAQMAQQADDGIKMAEAKFSSVGTFSAFESSKLNANNYDKKIADYNLEQLRIQRDLKQLIQNQSGNAGAVFA